MTTTASLSWFAHHEARLAWRDFMSMLTAGKRRRERGVAVAFAVFMLLMHLIAIPMVGRYAEIGFAPDKATLVAISGTLLLMWSLMASQAMESVTRAFYARADLDLILSSPTATRRLFAVRIATMAAGIAAMALVLAAPFIDVLAWYGGAHWLAAYGVVGAMGATAAAFAVAVTIALFRSIGPRRTRFVAQVLAAVIGAAFVIGLQVAAIVSYGTMSRTEILKSDAVIAWLPDAGSAIWWPARAALGDGAALLAVMVASTLVLASAVLWFSARFAGHAVAALGADMTPRRTGTAHAFRATSPGRALRRKEWTLLARDPWLVSQTLMQMLYLIPPAVMLWQTYGDGGALLVLVPVLVMAAGQLAGGIAWLAISGEDAPDLIATAPIPAGRIVRAKLEAVFGCIAAVFAPFVAALAFVSPPHAAISAVGIALAASASTAIQFWFRAQAKRSHFRRRQTSSRIATFAEAFSSIAWAATAALAAAGTWLAAIPAVVAVGVLFGARAIAPRQ
jgi:ABC-2 type transport system permease protein